MNILPGTASLLEELDSTYLYYINNVNNISFIRLYRYIIFLHLILLSAVFNKITVFYIRKNY